LLFATGALGAGVDVNGIKAVVHIGHPYGMINFDQEVGRGGRGGEVVTSVILVADDDYIQLLAEEPEMLPVDERAMREFMVTNGCRREELSVYMNGEDERVDCKSLGGELCDRCKDELAHEESGKRRREADEKEVRELKRKKGLGERERLLRMSQMEKGERLVRAMERHKWLQGKCAVCWLDTGDVEQEHITRLCPKLERMVGQKYKDFRARYLGYNNSTTCYKCGLPGDLCESYSNKRRCEDADVVLPLAVAAFLDVELGFRDRIKEVARKEFDNVISYGAWLVEKGRWLGENGSNAFRIFEAIVGSKGNVD
jgi:superfamily II DNA/RNA helicase